jgi:hypothetical protein
VPTDITLQISTSVFVIQMCGEISFRIVLFSCDICIYLLFHAVSLIWFSCDYAVSPVIVLLLDTFAEVLCFECGRCSLQFFVDCDDVIKSPHL